MRLRVFLLKEEARLKLIDGGQLDTDSFAADTWILTASSV
jgi:hypothetical protein